MNEDGVSTISLSDSVSIQERTQPIEKDYIMTVLETIEKQLSSLDKTIKEGDAKVDELNRLVNNLMKNKSINLDDTCKILIFQIEILNNERTYVQNLKNIFLTRFQKDLYEIGEKTMVVATSINSIQFEEEELNRNKTQKKVMPVKKHATSSFDSKSVYMNVDSIFNNLSIIKDTATYLDSCLDFINQNIADQIRSDSIANTHSSSLKLKRDYINVEFKQLCDALKFRVNYFAELLAGLIKKMKV